MPKTTPEWIAEIREMLRSMPRRELPVKKTMAQQAREVPDVPRRR